MRITFFINRADLSGATRVVAIYADRLKRRGHEVVVVSRSFNPPTMKDRLQRWMGRRPTDPLAGPSHLDGTEIDHRTIDGRRPPEARDLPNADVIVAATWEAAELIQPLPRHAGAKVYFVQNHEVHAGLPIERVEATWRAPMHKIVIAQWLADLAKHRFGDRDVSLVPNSVDTTLFHAPPRQKQDVPTVGLMYSTATFKGCDISVRAFEMARERVRGLRLVAFGNTTPRPPVLLPAGTRFAYQPPQETLRDTYASCDAWLFASRSEGFGLPILEAMACRTPVIATPAGAAPELLASQGGILVHPEHCESMADAIIRIAQMPNADWTTMADRAYATATRYTWDQATDRFETALERALAKQNNPTSRASK
ncbi:MAG TPA: glycosyltransferase family 4 protein [Tepidisphaeraceae bacterium]|jgi:glycosyltransferase involved in cell wall biosynthesis|nr:glycosyltransferase family 4 protein [Tepidisphaeraceae bacterium]